MKESINSVKIEEDSKFKKLCGVNGSPEKQKMDVRFFLMNKYENIKKNRTNYIKGDYDYRYFKLMALKNFDISTFCHDYLFNIQYLGDYYYLDENASFIFTQLKNEYESFTKDINDTISLRSSRNLDTKDFIKNRDRAIKNIASFISSIEDKLKRYKNLDVCNLKRSNQLQIQEYKRKAEEARKRKEEPIGKQLGRASKELNDGLKKTIKPFKDFYENFKEGYND